MVEYVKVLIIIFLKILIRFFSYLERRRDWPYEVSATSLSMVLIPMANIALKMRRLTSVVMHEGPLLKDGSLFILTKGAVHID